MEISNIVEISNIDEARQHEQRIYNSAAKTIQKIQALASGNENISLLEQIKFERIGCNPLDSNKPWNVIEQVNQTFTYIASFRAAMLLFERHPEMNSLTLHLGTAEGTDIVSTDDGGIAAEVFAATHPKNNRKLKKDIAKVKEVSAQHKYVFFMCPDIKAGEYKGDDSAEVIVWSLGL